MKQIAILYFAAIFGCFVLGVIVALAVHFTPWYLILLMFPISLGWLPIAKMLDNVSESLSEYLFGTSILVSLVFIALIIALIFGAVYVDEKSFWGVVYICTVFSSLIETIVIMLRLHTKWQQNVV